MLNVAAGSVPRVGRRTGARVSGPIRLPTRTQRWAVVTAPTLQDQKEHLEIRTHKRLIEIRDATPDTVAALQRLDGLPTGVDIQIRVV